MKKAAKKKMLDKAAVAAAAHSAGMTLSEFLEWGLYCILETYTGPDFHPHDAKDGLKKLYSFEGRISGEIIPTNPLAEFAADADLHFGELNELALLAVINIMNSSDFPDKQPRDMLEDARQTHGALIPSFKEEKISVHPLMQRLFSGDLRAIHGHDFGDLCSNSVDGEHRFLEDNLKRAFHQNTWDEACCELMIIESVIRHCPKLQNEAAAIRTLIEAERVLGDFCRAVNAA